MAVEPAGAGGVWGGWLVAADRARASGDLPALLDEALDADELSLLLGGTDADRRVVADLVAERIVADPMMPVRESHIVPDKRVVFTRSGVEFTGIDGIARRVHRIVMPVVESWLGRIAMGVLVVAGVIALIVGRSDGPQVSAHPGVDATVGLILGLGLAALHELAHAVALVHYGRTPRSAGCGFYWGALCFYVDSSDGTTLPRRARIINALAGLAVDVVTTSVLLLVSHAFAASVLVMSVCWRLAIVQLIGIVENGLPILEVDGHVALADCLDEPDLSPRSREALSRRLRGVHQHERPSWLAAYGAFSLVGGIVLLVASTWVWWLAAGEMITALFGGNIAEILLGLYVVVPVALAALFSGVGLGIEFVAKPTAADHDQATSSFDSQAGR